jgi:alpha-glucosidase
MVGSDGKSCDCPSNDLYSHSYTVCGFIDNTTETLCARWAILGAFSPFYRNHNDIASIPQEFYRWPNVARAAKAAIEIRYKLLDYLYTAFHKNHVDGTPVVQPLFFSYPQDSNTFGIEHQFFFGDAVMVCPVLEEGNEVEIYLADDIYYELVKRRAVYGPGEKMWVRQVEIDEIPLLIRGGKIIPMRVESAMTTTELRKKDFEIVVAPGIDGTASGTLYVDDGVSLEQDSTLEASYLFDGTKLSVSSTGHYNTGVQYAKIAILGVDAAPDKVYLTLADGTSLQAKHMQWDSENEVLNIEIDLSMSKSFNLELFWQPDEDISQQYGKEQFEHSHDHRHDEL